MKLTDLIDKIRKTLERASEWALGAPGLAPVPVPVKSGKKTRPPR